MRRLPLSLGALLLLCSATVTSCMHKGSASSGSKSASPYVDSDQDLTSDLGSRPVANAGASNCEEIKSQMCTMEYSQQVCDYQGTKIEATNGCKARLEAKYLACKSGKTFAEADLKCNVTGKLNVEEPADRQSFCEKTVKAKDPVCNRMYVKTDCTFNDIKVEGSNECVALNNLAFELCLKEQTFDREKAACVPQNKGEVK